MVSSGEGGTDEKVVVARKRELPYARCPLDVMPESCPRRCVCGLYRLTCSLFSDDALPTNPNPATRYFLSTRAQYSTSASSCQSCGSSMSDPFHRSSATAARGPPSKARR